MAWLRRHRGKLVLLALVGAAWGGLRWWRAANAPPPPVPRTGEIARGDIRRILSATGIVEPAAIVEVKSQAAGEVVAVVGEPGDRVVKGQVLVRIDPTIERRRLGQAQASLRGTQGALAKVRRVVEIRKSELARARDRLTRGVAPAESVTLAEEALSLAESEVPIAEASLSQARTALAEARDRMADTVLTSPIEGIVLRRTVEPGMVIASGTASLTGGTPLLTLADVSRLYVRADVDEADVGHALPGQYARVVVESFPERVFHGRVDRVSPEGATVQNVTIFPVRVALGPDAVGILRAAMTANVEIVAETRTNVILAPAAAVRVHGGRPSVEVLVDGKTRWTAVREGVTDGRRTEVEGDLAPGQRAILPGPAKREEKRSGLFGGGGRKGR